MLTSEDAEVDTVRAVPVPLPKINTRFSTLVERYSVLNTDSSLEMKLPAFAFPFWQVFSI